MTVTMITQHTLTQTHTFMVSAGDHKCGKTNKSTWFANALCAIVFIRLSQWQISDNLIS